MNNEQQAAAVPAQLPEVLLIDLSALFWAAWHSTGNDGVSNAVNDVIKAVHECHQGDFSRKVVICCDSGRSFRKEMSADYKAKRPEKDQRAIDTLKKIQQRLRDDGFLLWAAETFEADDIIATATEQAVARGHAVMVATHDKDLLQLVSAEANVRACRTHLKFAVWEEKDVVAKYCVGPDQLGDWLALVGDTSDNIKGAPGVGDKTAAELLNRFGTLTKLYEAISVPGANVPVRPSIIKSLLDNRAQVELARQLVALRTDAPIVFAEIYEKRERKAKSAQVVANDAALDGEPTAGAQPEAAPPPANDPKLTALAPTVIPPGGLITRGQFEFELEPRTPSQAMGLARYLHDSGLYSKFPNPEAIFAAIIMGREEGLPAMKALQVIHVIDGTPAMAAHYLIAKVQAHPKVEFFECVESDAVHAKYRGKLKKSKHVLEHIVTINDIVDKGLCGMDIVPRSVPFGLDPKTNKPFKDHRGSWDKSRPAMLRKTCGVEGGRILIPAAILGLYSLEELGIEVG